MKADDKLLEEVKKLDVRGYCGLPEEDNMILDWWTELVTTGELDKIFSKSCYSLGGFFKLFQRPNWLFYSADQHGFKFCIWAEPMFSTACVGLWVSPRHRKSRSVFRSIQLVYHTLFTMFNCILGVTKQEDLLTAHVDVGYTVVGKVNGLVDDQPAWIVHLTRESFKHGKLNPERR